MSCRSPKLHPGYIQGIKYMLGKGANLSDGLKDMSDITASYLNISRLQCSRQEEQSRRFYKTIVSNKNVSDKL